MNPEESLQLIAACLALPLVVAELQRVAVLPSAATRRQDRIDALGQRKRALVEIICGDRC